MPPKFLSHIRLPSPIHYQEASKIQESLVRRFLDAKASNRQSHIRPTVLTMQMHPVYTTGRRDRGSMTAVDKARLERNGTAQVVESLRGGQTTFHGPGQLVAYPILDLSPSSSGFDKRARCYVYLLEQVIIQTLAHCQIAAQRTENTGVWTLRDEKIAAIGVHLRRNITSHGIALNVATDLSWFDHIVACGLVDKKTTSMAREGSSVGIERVTDVFVEELAKELGCEGVVVEEMALD